MFQALLYSRPMLKKSSAKVQNCNLLVEKAQKLQRKRLPIFQLTPLQLPEAQKDLKDQLLLHQLLLSLKNHVLLSLKNQLLKS